MRLCGFSANVRMFGSLRLCYNLIWSPYPYFAYRPEAECGVSEIAVAAGVVVVVACDSPLTELKRAIFKHKNQKHAKKTDISKKYLQCFIFSLNLADCSRAMV
jgi:hypothetical protein